MKKLLIVESPNKIKKIASFLGSEWVIKASFGHIRDLPKVDGSLGIVFNNGNIIPNYQVTQDKIRTVQELKNAAKDADEIYLASDPDREGEAIGWHVAQILGRNKTYHRVRFQEITKNGVIKAIQNTSTLDVNLVNAQQARRVLDRIVGWWVSGTCRTGTGDPKAKSAGRVQSPALRIIVEREEDIQNFKPQNYFTLKAQVECKKNPPAFTCNCVQYEGIDLTGKKKDGEKTLPGFKTKESVEKAISRCKSGIWKVEASEVKDVLKNPFPPFETATVTQAASASLKMKPDETMKTLQSLFEGGHITYHRTDSTNISDEGILAARSFIKKEYGDTYLPKAPNKYASKDANAQEAHECIRPTHLEHGEFGEGITNQRERDLYRLIWQRFVACQMNPGIDKVTTVILSVSDNTKFAYFKATGSIQRFDGYRLLTSFAHEDESSKAKKKRGEKVEDDEDDQSKTVPPLSVTDIILLLGITSQDKVTKPPIRYTQASLIKTLKSSGIGRPATYAAILTKLIYDQYIIETNQALSASPLGIKLVNFLKKSYNNNFIEIDYTAKMEETLDSISRGEKEWQSTITEVAQELLNLAHKYGFRTNDLKLVDQIIERKYTAIKIDIPSGLNFSPCKKCNENIGWIMLSKTGKMHVCQGNESGEVIRIPQSFYPCKKCNQQIGFMCINEDGSNHQCKSAGSSVAKTSSKSSSPKKTSSKKDSSESPSKNFKPCNKCGKPISFKKNEKGWTLLNEDGSIHQCKK